MSTTVPVRLQVNDEPHEVEGGFQLFFGALLDRLRRAFRGRR